MSPAEIKEAHAKAFAQFREAYKIYTDEVGRLLRAADEIGMACNVGMTIEVEGMCDGHGQALSATQGGKSDA